MQQNVAKKFRNKKMQERFSTWLSYKTTMGGEHIYRSDSQLGEDHICSDSHIFSMILMILSVFKIHIPLKTLNHSF